jgi:protein-tyrosine phosphatase
MQVSAELNSTPVVRSILVLCEGSLCRSRVAEGQLRSSRDIGIKVESIGFDTLVDFPTDSEAKKLMTEIGISVSHHCSGQLTTAMVPVSEPVLTMDQPQLDCCDEMVPRARGRDFLLGHWLPFSPREVCDPFPQGPEAFRSVFEIILHSVASWLPCMVPTLRSA